MKDKSFRAGFGFGIASGVITTLGLIIGLYASTNSLKVVLGGIITIAIADSFSDAFGMHLSQEAQGTCTKHIWLSSLFTFLFKFIITISFLPIFFITNIKTGIILDIIWGYILLVSFSYFLAKKTKNSPIKVILEHFAIMSFVIIATYYVGLLIEKLIFKN